MNVASSRSKPLPQLAWESLLDALFPPRCAGCTEWCRAAFCPFCIPKLRPITMPLCLICGEPFDPLALAAPQCSRCRAHAPRYLAARAAFRFNGPVRDAVHRLKYHEKSALAPRLAPYLAEVFQSDPILHNFKADWIVPIPLHPRRLKKRGFNQSLLLGRELGRILEIPVSQTLTRVRDTTPQVALKRDERAKNMRDAFSLDSAAFAKIQGQGARFLLIDDVSTTGATLDDAARVLKKAGASEVCALTLARSTHY